MNNDAKEKFELILKKKTNEEFERDEELQKNGFLRMLYPIF